MKDKILELRALNYSVNRIAEELNCAVSTVSYHVKKNGLSTVKKISDEQIILIKDYYLTHTTKETAEFFGIGISTVKKYVDNKRVFLTDVDRKKNNVKSVLKRRLKIKEKSVEYKGGQCERCGYNKYIGALEFHHLDPKEKDITISKSGHCSSWEKVKNELDKCILVCSNCHREIHEELRKSASC